MSYLKDREIWLSNVPTGNPPAGYFWKFIQNGKVVVRDSSGNNQMMIATSGSQAITGSLTVTEGITGTVSSASYIEYSNVANKPTLVSGSSQVVYSGLTGIPVGIVSGSAQVSFNGIVDKPTLVSGSAQVTYSGLTGVPVGIVSGSAQVTGFGIFATTGSNQFNGSQAITGSLTVTGAIVAQTLNVQQVTSSVVFSSGSNVFGNSLGNTQQFTGSMLVTGSLAVVGAGTFSNSVVATRILINSSDAAKTPLLLNAEGNFAPSGSMTNGFAITNTSFGRALNIGVFESGAYGWIQSAYINNADTTFALALQPRGGNVGIGEINPGSRLEIKGANTDQIRIAHADNSTTKLHIGQFGDGSYIFNNYMFVGGHTTDDAAKGSTGIILDTADILFQNAPASATPSRATRMAILANGNVGIGTTAPVSTNLNSALTIYKIYNNDSSSIPSPNAQLYGNNQSGLFLFGRNSGLTIVGANSEQNQIIFANSSTVAYASINTTTGTNSVGGDMYFNVGSNTERMRITSGGNVGIGTTNPFNGITSLRGIAISDRAGIFQLNVNNHTYLTSNLYYDGTDWRRIVASGGSFVQAGDLDGGQINFFGSTSGAAGSVASLTQRMTITPGGFLKASNTGTYISSTGPYHEARSNQNNETSLIVSHTHVTNPQGVFSYFSDAAPNNTNSRFFIAEDNAAKRFEVRANGGIANFSANNVNLSDERTKKEIEPLESYWDKFKAIEIVKFKYKDQTHDDFNIGVIAQQVQAVAPEFVDIDGWDTKPKLDEEGNEIESEEEPLKSIYTADLYHATIKVLQEAMSKIEEQQSLIESLKSRIEILEQ